MPRRPLVLDQGAVAPAAAQAGPAAALPRAVGLGAGSGLVAAEPDAAGWCGLGSAEWALALWVRGPEVAVAGRVLDLDAGRVRLAVDGSGRLVWSATRAARGSVAWTWTDPTAPGAVWTSLVVQRRAGQVEVWRDGVLAHSAALEDLGGGGGGLLRLGAEPDVAGAATGVRVAQPAAWARALSAGEVAALAAGAAWVAGDPEPVPGGWTDPALEYLLGPVLLPPELVAEDYWIELVPGTWQKYLPGPPALDGTLGSNNFGWQPGAGIYSIFPDAARRLGLWSAEWTAVGWVYLGAGVSAEALCWDLGSLRLLQAAGGGAGPQAFTVEGIAPDDLSRAWRVTTAPVLPLGTWAQIAVRQTGGLVQVLLDGTVIATATQVGALTATRVAPTRFGGEPGGTPAPVRVASTYAFGVHLDDALLALLAGGAGWRPSTGTPAIAAVAPGGWSGGARPLLRLSGTALSPETVTVDGVAATWASVGADWSALDVLVPAGLAQDARRVLLVLTTPTGEVLSAPLWIWTEDPVPGPDQTTDPAGAQPWIGDALLLRVAQDLLLLCPCWQDLVADRWPLAERRTGTGAQTVTVAADQEGDWVLRYPGEVAVSCTVDGIAVRALQTRTPAGAVVTWHPLIGLRAGQQVAVGDTTGLAGAVLARTWSLAPSLIELSQSEDLPVAPFALVDVDAVARSPRSVRGWGPAGTVGYELCLAAPAGLTEPQALRWASAVLGLITREVLAQLRRPGRFVQATLRGAGPVLMTEGGRFAGRLRVALVLEYSA